MTGASTAFDVGIIDRIINRTVKAEELGFMIDRVWVSSEGSAKHIGITGSVVMGAVDVVAKSEDLKRLFFENGYRRVDIALSDPFALSSHILLSCHN